MSFPRSLKIHRSSDGKRFCCPVTCESYEQKMGRKKARLSQVKYFRAGKKSVAVEAFTHPCEEMLRELLGSVRVHQVDRAEYSRSKYTDQIFISDCDGINIEPLRVESLPLPRRRTISRTGKVVYR